MVPRLKKAAMDIDVRSSVMMSEKVTGEEEVECVRCCLLFTIMLAMGLVVDPLPKLLPGYFIVKLLCYSWTLINEDMMEAGNTKGNF